MESHQLRDCKWLTRGLSQYTATYLCHFCKQCCRLSLGMAQPQPHGWLNRKYFHLKAVRNIRFVHLTHHSLILLLGLDGPVWVSRHRSSYIQHLDNEFISPLSLDGYHIWPGLSTLDQDKTWYIFKKNAQLQSRVPKSTKVPEEFWD